MKTKRKAPFLLILAALALAAGPGRAQDEKKAEPASTGVLRAGYRGLTLAMPGNELTFIGKGDRVDVLVTFDAKTAADPKEKVTATILQNVVVLGVRLPASADGNGSIELEVNPNEAQYAALSIQQGAIRLLRRAEGDMTMKPMEMASFRKLFR
jgi:Flp pilus assembly protein CpaB